MSNAVVKVKGNFHPHRIHRVGNLPDSFRARLARPRTGDPLSVDKFPKEFTGTWEDCNLVDIWKLPSDNFIFNANGEDIRYEVGKNWPDLCWKGKFCKLLYFDYKEEDGIIFVEYENVGPEWKMDPNNLSVCKYTGFYFQKQADANDCIFANLAKKLSDVEFAQPMFPSLDDAEKALTLITYHEYIHEELVKSTKKKQ